MLAKIMRPLLLASLMLIHSYTFPAEAGQETGTEKQVSTEESVVVKGLDVGKFRKLAEEVRTHPEYADVEFRAKAESEDVVYHGTVKMGPFSVAGQEYGQTRDHILHLGVPIELQAEVVSPVDRIEPVELALAGMADCVIGTIAVYAAINGIEVDKIRATVRAPLSLQIFAGAKGLDQRDEIYGDITIDVELEGDNLTENDRVFLTKQAKRSPVFNLIALAHDIEPMLTIKRGNTQR
ncbi:MAG: OsmC family protein [Acidobacteriota bacterium]